MRPHHRLAPWLAATALLAAACGRGDDATDDTAPPVTTAPTNTGAATTAPAGSTTPPAASPAATTAPATTGAGTMALTAADIAARCASEPPQATEIGVSESEITIEVAADVGSPLAPGLFQGAFDAVTAFADHINANGGIGCRQLVVRTWDTKMDPNEAKNGQIDACANAVAMVGNVALFNPDVTALTSCVDMAGAPTGVPDIAAVAQDVGELCGSTVFVIQLVVENCPIAVGQPRDMTAVVGPTGYLVEQHPDLHGLYLVPGDLPTTRQSAVPQIAGQETKGVVFDDAALVSGRDEQAAFTPRVQALKANGATYVYNGSNDVALMKMQKEAAAQGIDMASIVWACTLACYTRNFQENAGEPGEGTYMWMQFLPFEEADTNAALQAYVDGVGADKVDAFGAQAWQAAIAFQQVVNQIVMDDGPNAITRSAIIQGLAALEDFGADGWAGPKGLRETSDCFVLLQLRDGEFQRVWPEERGTFDCKPENLAVVTVEPVSAAEQYG